MAKWHGVIGYATQKQVSPGVWDDVIIEREYSGDVLRNSSRWSTTSESTNDDLNVNVQLSIVADPFAYQNYHLVKYIEFMGVKTKVTSIEPSHPRMLLTIGGVYNG